MRQPSRTHLLQLLEGELLTHDRSSSSGKVSQSSHCPLGQSEASSEWQTAEQLRPSPQLAVMLLWSRVQQVTSVMLIPWVIAMS